MQNAGAPTLEVWTSLLIAHRRLTAQLDSELRGQTGMTLDEYDVLYQLRRANGPLRMTQLAERALISRPTTSRVVDRLVEREWLTRWHDDRDRRVVLVALTAEGRRQQSRAGRVHLDGIARLVERPLAGHDAAALAAGLRALAQAGENAARSGQQL